MKSFVALKGYDSLVRSCKERAKRGVSEPLLCLQRRKKKCLQREGEIKYEALTSFLPDSLSHPREDSWTTFIS